LFGYAKQDDVKKTVEGMAPGKRGKKRCVGVVVDYRKYSKLSIEEQEREVLKGRG
jgi:hypothetical protein